VRIRVECHRQVYITRPERTVPLQPRLCVEAEDPEGIEEALDINHRTYSSVEELCREVYSLLRGNPRVHLEADYFTERSWMGKDSLEVYSIISSVFSTGGREMCSIGVRVTGMTTCPCAMETVKELTSTEASMTTHNQRNISSVVLTSDRMLDIEADDLISVVEHAQSGPTRELLKRREEGELVYSAHTRPRFVEDVVRNILLGVVERYPDLPEETVVEVHSESQESIHKHDAFAERFATVAEIKKEMEGGQYS